MEQLAVDLLHFLTAALAALTELARAHPFAVGLPIFFAPSLLAVLIRRAWISALTFAGNCAAVFLAAAQWLYADAFFLGLLFLPFLLKWLYPRRRQPEA